MHGQIIELREVLEIMRTPIGKKPQAFSIDFVPYNTEAKKASSPKKIDKAILCYSLPTGTKKKSLSIKADKKQRKDPNNFANGTIQIEVLGGEHKIETVHIHAIRYFNNMRVTWNING